MVRQINFQLHVAITKYNNYVPEAHAYTLGTE